MMNMQQEGIDFKQASFTIRQKMRKKCRAQHLQKSFRQTRQYLLTQQKQYVRQKRERFLNRTTSYMNQSMVAQQSSQNIQNNSHIVQPFQHQNLCYNANNNIINLQNQPNILNNNNKKNDGGLRQIYGVQQLINNIRPIHNKLVSQNQQQFINYINRPHLPNVNNKINNKKQDNQKLQTHAQRLNNKISYQNQRKQVLHNIQHSPVKQNKLIQQNNPRIEPPKQVHKIKLKYSNYLVYQKILGTGTYSKVYLGLNLTTNKYVAVKQITELQQNQIKVLMSVKSPYVINLQYFWKDRNTNCTYLVLELCDRNLRQEIKKGITFQQNVVYIQQIVKGIDILFNKNIIHRDLKFQNILVTCQKVIKITDFGLAKDMGMMSNVASLRCGTPYTMAPQIFFHNGYNKPNYSQKCDIWSLGIIIHEMIHKKHPFNYQSERLAKMDRVYVQKRFGYLDAIIDKCLVKNPNNRMQWNNLKQILQNKGDNRRFKQINNTNNILNITNQSRSKNKNEKQKIVDPVWQRCKKNQNQIMINKQPVITRLENNKLQNANQVNNIKKIQVQEKPKIQREVQLQNIHNKNKNMLYFKQNSNNKKLQVNKIQQKQCKNKVMEDPYRIFRQVIPKKPIQSCSKMVKKREINELQKPKNYIMPISFVKKLNQQSQQNIVNIVNNQPISTKNVSANLILITTALITFIMVVSILFSK